MLEYLFDPNFQRKSCGGNEIDPLWDGSLFTNHNELCGPRLCRSDLDQAVKKHYDAVEGSSAFPHLQPSIETCDARVNRILALRDIWDSCQPQVSDTDGVPATPRRRVSIAPDDPTPDRLRARPRPEPFDERSKRRRT